MKTTSRVASVRTAAAALPGHSANRRALLALACLLLAATAAVGVASANEGSASRGVATVPLMSQEALLEQQAKHADHLLVLDVRSPQEYAEGHVPGAVNVPHDQLASRLAEIPKDKDVVVYCRSGRRSAIATDILAANGYRRVSHLEGDMLAWQAKGRPVVKP